MKPFDEVLFEEIVGNDHLGVIILNRPQALNALTHDMVLAMYDQLQIWAQADHIKAIVVKASGGRSFCAGGDLRSLYNRYQNKEKDLTVFFRDEYKLNKLIYHYPKPYIALLDGITMGGGVGISIHGSHRVATDKLLFAMPETGIGFYPDVGGTYFLPRLPFRLGYYLGLTGHRIDSDACLALGIVQHKIQDDAIENLIHELASFSFGSNPKEDVTQVIRTFQAELKPSKIMDLKDTIASAFSEHTLEAILNKLERLQPITYQEIEAIFNKKSPTSLKVTLQALQRGEKLDFDQCMQQEFYLTSHFVERHDFLEGIRAVIIDKDQNPRWKPDDLHSVTDEMVDSYFSKVNISFLTSY